MRKQDYNLGEDINGGAADNTVAVAEGTADAPYKKRARSPGLNGLFNSKRMEMIRWFIFILLIKLMAEVIHRSRSIDLGGHVEQYDHGTVHPPYPFESEMVEEDGTLDENALEDAPHSAVICGAVKEFGHTHLLEQTRNLPDTIVDDMASNEVEHRETVGKEVIYGASVQHINLSNLFWQKKRSLTKATKERMGRQTISTADYKVEYAKVVKCSKVEWTEDGKVVSGKEDIAKMA